MAKVLTEKSNYEDIADAIREKNGTGETYLPSEMAGAIRSIHGDVTGVKGDAESNYRTGNVNLTPANIGAKATQTPVTSPSASGTAVEFIDSITQNAQGVITPTKKVVRTATASQSGLMSAADKGNLENLQTRMVAMQIPFSVCAFNIGNFAYGDLSGGTSPGSPRKSNTSGRRGPIGNDTMYDQLVDTFTKCDADIYLFCEWNRYWNKNWTAMDEENDILSMDVLSGLKPYWTVHNPTARSDKYAGHKIASNYPISSETAIAYGNDEDRYFIDAVCNVFGREVHFVSLHLNPRSFDVDNPTATADTPAYKSRETEFTQIQTYLESVNAEYVVLGGDFNIGGPDAETVADAAADLQMLSDAGYVCMQGGFFGKATTGHLFDTLNANEWPPVGGAIRPYDNIAVTPNMAIIGARVVNGNGSDHYPVVVDIVFKD